MKKFLVIMIVAGITTNVMIAQESKSEAKERHKNYWKKVGTDTRDFWKGEHEKKMKKKEEKERRSTDNDDKEERKEPRKPPKPPNPFKKKSKPEAEGKER